MGAQWKHAGRLAGSAKRGAMISKLVKEIMVAAKIGGADQGSNFRLRTAVEAAKKASVPRENIERGIKKGAGIGEDAVVYELLTFEGFAPHKVPVIVECLTDNKNRTPADIRVAFRKGQLGAQGSVAWMFDRLGVVEGSIEKPGLDIEGVAIEAGAQNVEALEAAEVVAGHTGARFFCDAADLDSVSKSVTSMGWTVTLSEMSYIAKSPVEVSDAQKKEVTEFLESVDDNDDVHRVYVAMR